VSLDGDGVDKPKDINEDKVESYIHGRGDSFEVLQASDFVMFGTWI
jgi:hypothetical protein